MSYEFSTPWLIPLFPLIGFAICGLFGARMPKPWAGVIATAVVFLSFAISLWLWSQGVSTAHVYPLAPWFEAPAFNGMAPLQVNFELLIDPLSMLMLMIITGVGGLIHLYSIGYMREDPGFARFFTYLNLFIFFMLLLVMGNNMVLMFVGWEGVGLCSYLLIGFWFEKKSAADAAKKAMIMNRIGDVGVLIGMFLAFQYFGTLDFHHMNPANPGLLDLAKNSAVAQFIVSTPALAAVVTLTTIMIFWGCTGKSAQIPLYTWLPDAMEGPTPVSALIHAATMVTAGVYLVSRMHSLFELSTTTMVVITFVGMATALFAASIALVQNDIKRVLAYSTMSQLGYMFAACGVGAFAAGMFHVLTHAFFKAALFLGSGAVIHAMEHAIHQRHEAEHGHHEAAHVSAGGPDPDDPQDIRNMGGLMKKLPITFWSMFFATGALAGIVPLSGWFSKDEILYRIAEHHTYVWLVGVVTAAMTAFYMTRMMYKAFGGTPKTQDAEHGHESPAVMWLPVSILAVLAVIGGVIGMPPLLQRALHVPNLLDGFLRPATEPTYAPTTVVAHHPDEALLLLISSVLAIVMVGWTYAAYKAKDGRDLIIPAADKPANGLYQLLLNKFYVDEVYNFFGVTLGRKLADSLYNLFDLKIVDGMVNLVGAIATFLGGAFRGWQNGYVRNYAFTILIAAIALVIITLVGFHVQW